jgi:hypothetical protein
MYIVSALEFPPNTSLFSDPCEQCTLEIVRNRLANWVIAALLTFQLAIGLQWQVAQAGVTPPEREMNGMGAGDCPDHPSKESRDKETANKHDCCRSLGCQCHCVQSPGALHLAVVGAALLPTLQLPVFDARPPVARTSELFRPPPAIA